MTTHWCHVICLCHTLFPSTFSLQGQTYRIGDCVYLPPGTYSFPVKPRSPRKQKKEGASGAVDEERYPEAYRKTMYVKGSNLDVPKPFQIGKPVHPRVALRQLWLTVCPPTRTHPGDQHQVGWGRSGQ